ncbi:hypothetical protein NCS57_00278000 [Fusarium keratoplasticum]|uniref:Uncharacterized protein n=1 Tax=Fusarium keratoplasticum TaxID=1328300 RepID=A0ACC0R9K9_9HYPO|nr:hypothetical protein NCS57_00278000 [Fusarium keratoplasticum]KAI8679984.1 hypothetical protein NCS57_00278000 [Fusarium keratoplasticum]
MSDERIYPAWVYCTHGFWYQGYWCCRDEQCQYRYEPVAAETADPSRTYDTAGHDGYGLAAGSGADGENGLGDGTFGYGGATAYDGWRGNHQPGSQQGQDAYQYGAQQYDNYQHDDYQQEYHWYNNQDDGQQSGYQEDVGRGDYRYPPNAQQPVPPSDAATTGSGSSASQTHSAPDDGASMVGNADEDTEDRTWSYLQEDNRDDQDVDEVMNLFPECPVGDIHYPRKLSIGSESESGVDQSNIEEKPDLGPR